eukprot:5225043-Heterocapsa_arctica.AAC.1
MQSFDVYKSARANKIEALESATVVLNSASHFLRQMGFLAKCQWAEEAQQVRGRVLSAAVDANEVSAETTSAGTPGVSVRT